MEIREYRPYVKMMLEDKEFNRFLKNKRIYTIFYEEVRKYTLNFEKDRWRKETVNFGRFNYVIRGFLWYSKQYVDWPFIHSEWTKFLRKPKKITTQTSS